MVEWVRSRIDDDATHDVLYYDPAFENAGQMLMGTSHMNVYATDGSAVSLTSTINTWYVRHSPINSLCLVAA
jgi:gamma-glutamyltranspeptidase/glutathione hydrolase/leukotriene-C4 hydrolase